MKTENEILTDICTIIQNSPINDLDGGIYKKVRPTDSELEDTVVSIISGVSAKFLQDGNLIIRIFFNKIQNQDTYYEDTARGQTLQALLWDLSSELLKTIGYHFDISTRELSIEEVAGVPQNFAVLRLNFEITLS